MKTNQQKRQPKVLGVTGLITLAALMLLACTQTVLAQQWSTPDSNGNISNTNTGNVGIGTQSPAGKLHVKGSAASIVSPVEVLRLDGGITHGLDFGTINLAPFSWWIQARDNSGYSFFYPLALNPQGGNVGIGTSNPGAKLQIASDANGGMRISADFAAAVPSVDFLTTGGLYAGTFGVANSPNQILDGSITSDFALRSQGNILFGAAGAEKMRLTSGGNLGIGTTTPANKLHVAGSITVDGNINAKFQDVAEWVPSSEKLPTGTVVVLDSTKSNQVVASTVSYDTRVAGVISEQPGIALGEKGESKVLVATTGRVRMKVDATGAPIHIGDLLVTSDVPGVAMKSEPVNLGGVQIHRPGTLIGKALEPLAKGSGEILVLLSLQ